MAQPVVRMFNLAAIFDTLGEHAEFIANTISEARIDMSSKGIEQTGCEAAKSSIPKRRVDLDRTYILQVYAKARHGLTQGFLHAEIKQYLGQQLAGQILKTEVINATFVHAATGDGHALPKNAPQEINDGVIPVT